MNIEKLEKVIYGNAKLKGISDERLITYEEREAMVYYQKITELRKKVFPSNISFTVNPLNGVQENLSKFRKVYSLIEEKELEFKFICSTFSKEIKLIRCEPAGIAATLREISDRGYVSVPSPFILGLGVEYSRELNEYHGCVTSLDMRNLFKDVGPYSSLLSLDFCGVPRLGLVKYFGKFSHFWRFAVVPKNIQFMNIRNCA